MILDAFFTFLVSLLMGLILTGILAKAKEKFEIIDRIGGISIYLSFLIAVLLIGFYSANIVSRELRGILIGSTLIILLGMLGDIHKSLAKIKFAGKLIAVVILIFFGVKTRIVLIPSHFNLFITAFWVLGITAAFKLLNSLDGLSAGLAFIVSFCLLLIAIFTSNLAISLMAAALAGSSLAFLRYNFPPKKLSLGRGAALFIGFTLSAMAICLRYATLENKIALLSPVIIFALPIFHLLSTMFMRLRRRFFFVEGSEDFISSLVARGYRPKRILFSMYLLGIFFSLCGIIIIRR